jgi:hypothetical protein
MNFKISMTEQEKLKSPENWRKWGSYVSERQWGTVREDYSADGNAWNFITHDMARSKAFRWGEEGIGGISDQQQLICLSLSLWNGKDPILKERFFGLTNSEGNHGEDVKELYYFLDNVPSHSYMKMLYKYPQQAFPYEWLLEENRKRSKNEPEFELIDTGIFNNDQYFDVFIEYAKNKEEDILIQYSVYNRADEDAPLHILPNIWFRNTLDWENEPDKPDISIIDKNVLLIKHPILGSYYLFIDGDAELLFTENETNDQKLYQVDNKSEFVKDGIHEFVVNGNTNSVNAQQNGTKVAAHFKQTIKAKSAIQIKMRLVNSKINGAFNDFDQILKSEKANADTFYEEKQANKSEDIKLIQRQAWAGLLWSKQYYNYNVNTWLKGDKGEIQPPMSHQKGRNSDWKHLMAADIISMPDTWEYPWFAAWDLAFHCIAFATIDLDFAKKQLLLLLEDKYLNPNGQLPAYEWNFSDVNPPVHALAAWKIYQTEIENKGQPDLEFLQEVFHKLMINFTWWVNKKDKEGNNIFAGGFLGLDNIGIFDRSSPLPGGEVLEQADGTSWMAMFSLNMMRIAMELACSMPAYEDMAIKFSDHYFYIAGAMANMGDDGNLGLWDEEDSFYYDLIRLPNGNGNRLKLRSLVGLLPLIAVEVIKEDQWGKLEKLKNHMQWFVEQRPDLGALVSNWQGGTDKNEGLHLLSLLRGHRMKCLLKRMLDETEFLADFGIRSVSKVYEQNPFNYWLDGKNYQVRYKPAESDTGMFGGNSNWRGPIWFPVNYLLIQALRRFYDYYGDDFKIEMPTGSDKFFTIKEIADEISERLNRIFLKDGNGQRAVFGSNDKLQTDGHFKDYILFHEYFDGNNGKGLGASHQTGWTALIATLI